MVHSPTHTYTLRALTKSGRSGGCSQSGVACTWTHTPLSRSPPRGTCIICLITADTFKAQMTPALPSLQPRVPDLSVAIETQAPQEIQRDPGKEFRFDNRQSSKGSQTKKSNDMWLWSWLWLEWPSKTSKRRVLLLRRSHGLNLHSRQYTSNWPPATRRGSAAVHMAVQSPFWAVFPVVTAS